MQLVSFIPLIYRRNESYETLPRNFFQRYPSDPHGSRSHRLRKYAIKASHQRDAYSNEQHDQCGYFRAAEFEWATFPARSNRGGQYSSGGHASERVTITATYDGEPKSSVFYTRPKFKDSRSSSPTYPYRNGQTQA